MVARCAADWHAKSVQIIACASKEIWQTEIQANWHIHPLDPGSERTRERETVRSNTNVHGGDIQRNAGPRSTSHPCDRSCTSTIDVRAVTSTAISHAAIPRRHVHTGTNAVVLWPRPRRRPRSHSVSSAAAGPHYPPSHPPRPRAHQRPQATTSGAVPWPRPRRHPPATPLSRPTDRAHLRPSQPFDVVVTPSTPPAASSVATISTRQSARARPWRRRAIRGDVPRSSNPPGGFPRDNMPR